MLNPHCFWILNQNPGVCCSRGVYLDALRFLPCLFGVDPKPPWTQESDADARNNEAMWHAEGLLRANLPEIGGIPRMILNGKHNFGKKMFSPCGMVGLIWRKPSEHFINKEEGSWKTIGNETGAQSSGQYRFGTCVLYMIGL